MGDPAIDVVGLRGWLRSFTTRLPYDVQPNLGHRNDRRGKERQENFLKKKKKRFEGARQGQNVTCSRARERSLHAPTRRASRCAVRPTMSPRQYRSR